MDRMKLLLLMAVPLIASCAQFTNIPHTHSALEQQLLIRALERSMDGLDTEQVAGNAVSLHLSALATDYQDFAREFIEARFREKNIRIVEKESEADQKVHVFAHVLGTDRGGALLGLPSLPTPFVNIATPEIALFKQDANRGRSETQIFVFDANSGRFVGKSPISVGRSKYDNYTVLILIDFTVEDIGLLDTGSGEG